MNRASTLGLVGLAVLIGLFVALRPPDDAPLAPAPPPAPAAGGATARAPESGAAELRIFRLEVAGGRLASGPTVISVHQGESLTLHVVSDQADQLHLHGYDLLLDLEPNTPATLSFAADRSGRFGYELHGAHHELGVLEVQPR
jgi:hypothetical protein